MPYKEEKACPKHKDRYLLLGKADPLETGLCCNPSCLKAAITQTAKRFKSTNKMVTMLRERDLLDETVSFVVMKLLQEARELGKPPVLNAQWLFYNLNKFIQDDIVRGGDIPQACVPPVWRKNIEIQELNDEVIDLMEKNEAVSLNDRYHHPEHKTYDANFLIWFEKVLENTTWRQFFLGEIGQRDAQKVLRLSPANFVKEAQKLRYDLAWAYRKFRVDGSIDFSDAPAEWYNMAVRQYDPFNPEEYGIKKETHNE